MTTEAQSASPDGEIMRLRQCIDNLISVQSLPALWSGRSPSQVVGMLQVGIPPERARDGLLTTVSSWGGADALDRP